VRVLPKSCGAQVKVPRLLRTVALLARRPGRDTERAMSQENVEIAAGWYAPATSKASF
jgi:hypothetical protein